MKSKTVKTTLTSAIITVAIALLITACGPGSLEEASSEVIAQRSGGTLPAETVRNLTNPEDAEAMAKDKAKDTVGNWVEQAETEIDNADGKSIFDQAKDKMSQEQEGIPVPMQEFLAEYAEMEIAPRSSEYPYDREEYDYGIDRNGDCRYTRAEVLIRDSTEPVTFAERDDGKECKVIKGKWETPWSRETFENAEDVEIDHHVPLAHAHQSGAWAWSPERKREFANDVEFAPALQVTAKSLNREKSDQSPEEWMPEDKKVQCRYMINWIRVKLKWGLTQSKEEERFLWSNIRKCHHPSHWKHLAE